jgi:cell division protein ZipA
MPELRWALLIIGVLFIAILMWWERRRPHQAARQSPHIGSEPRPLVGSEPTWGDAEPVSPPRAAEPALTLPEIHAEARVREVPRELPVVEIPADLNDEMAGDIPVAAQPALHIEPDEPYESDDIDLPARAEPGVERRPPAPPAPIRRAVPEPQIGEPLIEEPLEEDWLEEPIDEEAIVPLVEPSSAGKAGPGVELGAPMLPREPPLLEWPPEDQRKLLSLRLVARPPERFQGRLVRQALAAEGFVLGPLDIFHKPDAQNRSVLSAASLTKPGTFDLETMDTQRYAGLSLFAVLPGPRSAQKAFEDLLTTARMLNERLEGALQDDRGGPLTPTRIQILRDGLEAEDA